MRISVLAGLLVCTLVLVTSSSKAEAMSLDEMQNNMSTVPTIQLLDIAVDLPEELEINDTGDSNNVTKPQEVKKHTISENETLSEIAKIHNTTWKRVFDKNEQLSHPDIISTGEELIIPDAEEEIKERPLPIQEPEVANTNKRPTPADTSLSRTYVPSASGSGNKYIAGYCTWYVKNRRPDLPNNLGNAITWVSRASAQGIPTGSTPRVGAVGQAGNHVVYIESINADGTVTVSEMNRNRTFEITSRTVPASYFSYIY